ncbi:hypothetical protein [Puniceibacterium antarcticum]|nr:hypothetical protein [Puniceibacterium antarcticum]
MIVLTQSVVAFIGKVYSNFNTSDKTPAVSAFLVAMACGTLFIFLLPSIASALSGGDRGVAGGR